jgi:hypothetical protein
MSSTTDRPPGRRPDARDRHDRRLERTYARGVERREPAAGALARGGACVARVALGALIVSLLFLAFGGLYGGASMLLDPSGAALGMDVVLPLLPVATFVLPGLFLIVVMGLFPIVLAYGLVARPAWPGADAVARRFGHHWAWCGTLGLGLALGAWLALQAALIGFAWPIQYVTAGNAVAIVGLALVPHVRRTFVVPRG